MVSHSENPKPYHCEQCVLRFSNESHLKRHLKQMHKGEELYECNYCEMKFNKKHKLSRHMFIHTGHRNFKCYHPYCTKSYLNQGKLNLHIQKHHIGKQLVQQEPDSMDSAEDSGEKLYYKCPHDNCLKTYTTRYNLKVHLRTGHMGITPYRCECSMVFKHKCSLEKHRLKYAHEEIVLS
jgi:uncharacterized Zn-finger protein